MSYSTQLTFEIIIFAHTRLSLANGSVCLCFSKWPIGDDRDFAPVLFFEKTLEI